MSLIKFWLLKLDNLGYLRIYSHHQEILLTSTSASEGSLGMMAIVEGPVYIQLKRGTTTVDDECGSCYWHVGKKRIPIPKAEDNPTKRLSSYLTCGTICLLTQRQ